jgi:hypothetical protein
VSLLTTTGTPFVGYAQLTNGSPGPKAFTIFLTMGQASVAMPAGMRAYITNLTASSNDATPALVTFDSGGTTPTKFDSVYMSTTQQLQPQEIPPGILRGIFGVAPRIGATAVSVSSTVEAVIYGYLSAS